MHWTLLSGNFEHIFVLMQHFNPIAIWRLVPLLQMLAAGRSLHRKKHYKLEYQNYQHGLARTQRWRIAFCSDYLLIMNQPCGQNIISLRWSGNVKVEQKQQHPEEFAGPVRNRAAGWKWELCWSDIIQPVLLPASGIRNQSGSGEGHRCDVWHFKLSSAA